MFAAHSFNLNTTIPANTAGTAERAISIKTTTTIKG